MGKTNALSFRCSFELKNLLITFAQATNRTVSQVIAFAVEKYLKDNKNVLKDNKKVLKMVEEKRKRKIILNEIREKNSFNYIIKNAYRVILEQSAFFKLNSGSVNMIIVRKTIDRYIKLFTTFPKDVQKDLQNDMIAFENLKDEKIFYEKLNVFRILRKEVKQIK